MRIFYSICIIICINRIFADILIIKPSSFGMHSTSGKDWMYTKKPINIFGFGINSYVKNSQWDLKFDYLQIGLIGNVDQNIFSFSPNQSFAYLDKSKDADGYWTEYISAKLNYNFNDNTIIELGKFDRHWGNGYRSLHISSKTPSYALIGFKYTLNHKWKYIYFHGFLNSDIPDSIKSSYYRNNFSQRTINIPRNINQMMIEARF